MITVAKILNIQDKDIPPEVYCLFFSKAFVEVTEKEASVMIKLFRHDSEDGPLLFGTGNRCLDVYTFSEGEEDDDYE